MLLTLPGIVIMAGLFYLVASKAGWLESVARWSQRRGSGGGPRRPPSPPREGGEPPSRRLEVFEEFLRGLSRDESQDS